MQYKSLLFSFFLWISFNAAGQVAGKVDFHAFPDRSLTNVQINWSLSDEASWMEVNEGRLEIMGVSVDISSRDLFSGHEKSIFSFNLQKPGLIELYIEGEEFVENESIQLVDKNSGEIFFQINHAAKDKILTPAFDSDQTLVLWNGSKSSFIIETIYVHPADQSRSGQIGFNTALPCHPNAACKQDSTLILIANSSVRMRLVMEEGIGWCTGSFINNTRNDKTPYLLTAHHCTFNYTPRYDMWRFDLEYSSDSCENPSAEPPYVSITGCQLISKGQASDFLLVLLEENIPLNLKVTFAGWNRDDVITPDTSYLVHHPNADIRKISTTSNKAIIHPNQIGWSEGYTTPANHHFRFKFTEGGHQAGSSGGPVFNENGFLIGQLHGGNSGCEDVNSAFIGRFSKSWNLGATSSERLRDWLDPDATNIIQLPSLENLSEQEIIDIHGTVTDPLGRPVKNVTITVSGSTDDTFVTDDQGHFTLSSISRSGTYHLTPSKDINPTNGLNVLDIVSIQKHLLAKDTFDFTWQLEAADATNNNDISVGDILVLLRLLLGKIAYFPSSPSWRFEPMQMTLDSFPSGNFMEVQFTGIKIGDVNGTSDPSQ